MKLSDKTRLNDDDLQYLSGLSKDQFFVTLLDWLGGKDPRRNDLAADFIRQTGQDPTAELLSEAFAKGKSPKHRVRLLAAIEKIGHPLAAEQVMSLMPVAFRTKGVVQAQIWKLLAWNREATIVASQKQRAG
jgi:hypothetical protein